MKKLFTKIFITSLLGFYFACSLSFAQQTPSPAQEELQKALPPGIERVISIIKSYKDGPPPPFFASSGVHYFVEGTLGTGFFIEEDLLVTNYHALRNSIISPINSISYDLGLLIDGKLFSGVIAVYDEEYDLAIIKFEEKIGTPLELGNYKDLKSYDKITVHRFLHDWKPTIGSPIVGIPIERQKNRFTLFHHPIRGVYIGAPALSEDGKVVAIMHSTTERTSYGTPVTQLKSLLARMYSEGNSVVAQDLEKAKYWHEQGSTLAEENRPDGVGRVSTGYSSGTGFFITEDLLVTNHHVVEDIIGIPEARVRVRINGETFDGGVVATYDERNDLAIVKFKEKIGTPLELGSYKDLKLDDELTIYSFEPRDPIVGQSYQKRKNQLVHSQGIFAGYSGSPAVSEDGKVVAVMRASDSCGSYGVPVTYLKALLAQMYSEGNSLVAQDLEKAEYWHEQWTLDADVSHSLALETIKSLSDGVRQVFSGRGWGTGFFIEEDLLVTNYHVVANSINHNLSLSVKIDGETFYGAVATYDRGHDLAIVKFEEKIGTPLELGSYRDLKLEDEITVYSFTGMNPITGRSYQKQKHKFIHSQKLYGGYSGSPAVSKDGKVVAVMHSTDRYVSYGVPVTHLKTLLAEMYSEGNSLVAQDRDKAEYWYEQWALDAGIVSSVASETIESLSDGIQQLLTSDGRSRGSGFFIEEDLFVTNFHNVEKSMNSSELKLGVKIDGEFFPSVVAIYDEENDLAILKFEEKIGQPLELGNYKELTLYENITIYGYTFMGKHILTGQPYQKQSDTFIHSQRLYKGHGGSPALSEDGKVVAIMHSTRESASYGTPVTQLKSLLTRMYSEESSVVTQDTEKAKDWHEQWSNEVSAKEKLQLAQMYSEGNSVVAQDLEKARYLYEEVIKEDRSIIENTDIAFQLSQLYIKGSEKVLPNLEKAEYWYEQWFLVDGMGGQLQLAQMYAEGGDLPKNLKKAEYWYEQWALKAGTQAKKSLAKMYSKGSDGVPQNLEKAEYWYEQWAFGNVELTFQLAQMYSEGLDGLPQNTEKAKYLYEQIVKEDHFKIETSEFAFRLAKMYEDGRIFPKDIKQAVALYKKGYSIHKALSSFSGLMDLDYYSEENRAHEKAFDERDYDKADDILFSVVDKHYKLVAEAVFRLGEIYEQGAEGISQNFNQAEEYYYRSSMIGNEELYGVQPRALFRIGDLYGIDKLDNLYMAESYYEDAIEAGYKGAEVQEKLLATRELMKEKYGL